MEKGGEIFEKFKSEHAAVARAAQLRREGKEIYVIESRGFFYVDSCGFIRSWERQVKF